jgi:hypothetical protein
VFLWGSEGRLKVDSARGDERLLHIDSCRLEGVNILNSNGNAFFFDLIQDLYLAKWALEGKYIIVESLAY